MVGRASGWVWVAPEPSPPALPPADPALPPHRPVAFGRRFDAAERAARQHGYERLCEVDSEVLARVADEALGTAGLIRKLRWVEGSLAAAIVRLDDPTRIHLLRGNRPLAIHHVESWRATIWSSIAEDLDNVLGGARELSPMIGVTVRDGRPVRRFRLALREPLQTTLDFDAHPGLN